MHGRKPIVVVIGDLILDKYITGKCSRLSPEAPVPIVNVKKEEYFLGGAANVAENISKLGHRVALLGTTGKDEGSNKMRELCNQRGIITTWIEEVDTKSLPIKTRVMSNNQQMIRFDDEEVIMVETSTMEKISRSFENIWKEYEIKSVIFSDYAKGTITKELIQSILNFTEKKNIFTICDPKGNDIGKYEGIDLISPNTKEYKQLTKGVNNDELSNAKNIIQNNKNRYILLTKGAEGMTLYGKELSINIDANAKQVFDVTGAGDTVIATLAYCMANGKKLEEACHYANTAAGIVVGKVGTYSPSIDEIEELVKNKNCGEYIYSKKTKEKLLEKLASERKKGSTVVFTNGCFDILHIGHIDYLEKSKKMGDILIIGVNSDRSVKQLKGEKRPIYSEEERSKILSSLTCTDYIYIFDEETPYEIINSIKPDILVKGGDYSPMEIVGSDIVKKNGGVVTTVSYVEGVSTSGTIERILALA